MQLFHGSINSRIKTWRAWTHFGTMEQAEKRILNVIGWPSDKRVAFIYKVEANITNPLMLPDIFDSAEISCELDDLAEILEEEFKTEIEPLPETIVTAIQSRGFDAIGYENHHEGKGTSFVILNDRQASTIQRLKLSTKELHNKREKT